MFLTEAEFLGHFPKKSIGREQFIKRLTIMYSKPISLEQALSPEMNVKRKREDPRRRRDKVIDYFYQMLVTHRNYYLSKFYESYFSFTNPYETMIWNSEIDIHLPKNFNNFSDRTAGVVLANKYTGKWRGNLSLQKNDASRRIIRSLFYLQLLDETRITNTIKSGVSFWRGLVNLYNKLTLEDRFFAPSSVGLFLRPKLHGKTPKDIPKPPRGFSGFNPNLNYHNLFYLFQGYQPKASIINPYFIHWCLENLFSSVGSIGKKGKEIGEHERGRRILTPVLSWCSYLVAFMHTKGWTEYVGIDVMPSVCKKANLIKQKYRKMFLNSGKNENSKILRNEEKNVQIYCSPSEKLAKDREFSGKYHNYFDLVMICPPYFNMEEYAEGKQSTKQYKNYEDWLEGYWRPTTELSFKCCAHGGKFGLIINDYYTLEGDYYPLIKDLSKICLEIGFKAVGYYNLFNRTSPLRMNKKERTERLVIFTKL